MTLHQRADAYAATFPDRPPLLKCKRRMLELSTCKADVA